MNIFSRLSNQISYLGSLILGDAWAMAKSDENDHFALVSNKQNV